MIQIGTHCYKFVQAAHQVAKRIHHHVHNRVAPHVHATKYHAHRLAHKIAHVAQNADAATAAVVIAIEVACKAGPGIAGYFPSPRVEVGAPVSGASIGGNNGGTAGPIGISPIVTPFVVPVGPLVFSALEVGCIEIPSNQPTAFFLPTQTPTTVIPSIDSIISPIATNTAPFVINFRPPECSLTSTPNTGIPEILLGGTPFGVVDLPINSQPIFESPLISGLPLTGPEITNPSNPSGETTPVPEPTSLALLGGALAILGARKYGRKALEIVYG